MSDELVRVDVQKTVLHDDAATAAAQSAALTALQSIQNLVGALHDVGVDELDVQVITSALPSGAATSAKQTSMVTALQLIDDLRAALGDVATDELRVNVIASLPAGNNNIGNVDVVTMPTTTIQIAGGDKLLSFESVLSVNLADTDIGSGSISLDSTKVPIGKIWKITSASIMYSGTIASRLQFFIFNSGFGICLLDNKSPADFQWYQWNGEVYLKHDQFLRLYVSTATAGDNVYLRYVGVQMNAP